MRCLAPAKGFSYRIQTPRLRPRDGSVFGPFWSICARRAARNLCSRPSFSALVWLSQTLAKAPAAWVRGLAKARPKVFLTEFRRPVCGPEMALRFWSVFGPFAHAVPLHFAVLAPGPVLGACLAFPNPGPGSCGLGPWPCQRSAKGFSYRIRTPRLRPRDGSVFSPFARAVPLRFAVLEGSLRDPF